MSDLNALLPIVRERLLLAAFDAETVAHLFEDRIKAAKGERDGIHSLAIADRKFFFMLTNAADRMRAIVDTPELWQRISPQGELAGMQVNGDEDGSSSEHVSSEVA